MARPMWTGSITFGLVNIPVKLYPAVHEKDIAFHMLSKDGRCRLRRKLVCPETGKEYDYNDTVLGYEIAPDQYVVVQREELDQIRPQSGRTINIENFIYIEDVDPIYYDRAYYLGPDERGAKAYRLLYEAMKESGKAAIARFVMRNHEYLATLRVKGDLIALETMHYHDEVESGEDVGAQDDNVKVAKKELDLAKQLIDSLTEEFQPDRYVNEYQQQLQEMLDAKAQGKQVVTHELAPRSSGKVVDIMDALKKSLRAKGEDRKSSSSGPKHRQPPRSSSGGSSSKTKKRANAR